uniref:Ig-like domain-containing protein n=1 Tax=Biomphalaria glabrata TaxID=6526 RepID=A0A2C9M680_BIOGL
MTFLMTINPRLLVMFSCLCFVALANNDRRDSRRTLSKGSQNFNSESEIPHNAMRRHSSNYPQRTSHHKSKKSEHYLSGRHIQREEASRGKSYFYKRQMPKAHGEILKSKLKLKTDKEIYRQDPSSFSNDEIHSNSRVYLDEEQYQSDQESDQESKLVGKVAGQEITAGENERVLQLSSSTQTIVLGETETFSITCSVNLAALARSSKGTVQPMSLEIDKHDGQNRRRLAVLSAIHGAMPIRDELTSRAKITGSVSKDDETPWTMSINWSEPTSALEGTYICKLTAIGPHMALADHAYTKLEVAIR